MIWLAGVFFGLGLQDMPDPVCDVMLSGRLWSPEQFCYFQGTVDFQSVLKSGLEYQAEKYKYVSVTSLVQSGPGSFAVVGALERAEIRNLLLNVKAEIDLASVPAGTVYVSIFDEIAADVTFENVAVTGEIKIVNKGLEHELHVSKFFGGILESMSCTNCTSELTFIIDGVFSTSVVAFSGSVAVDDTVQSNINTQSVIVSYADAETSEVNDMEIVTPFPKDSNQFKQLFLQPFKLYRQALEATRKLGYLGLNGNGIPVSDIADIVSAVFTGPHAAVFLNEAAVVMAQGDQFLAGNVVVNEQKISNYGRFTVDAGCFGETTSQSVSYCTVLCRPGEYWDAQQKICFFNETSCPGNPMYDIYCVTVCPAGTVREGDVCKHPQDDTVTTCQLYGYSFQAAGACFLDQPTGLVQELAGLLFANCPSGKLRSGGKCADLCLDTMVAEAQSCLHICLAGNHSGSNSACTREVPSGHYVYLGLAFTCNGTLDGGICTRYDTQQCGNSNYYAIQSGPSIEARICVDSCKPGLQYMYKNTSFSELSGFYQCRPDCPMDAEYAVGYECTAGCVSGYYKVSGGIKTCIQEAECLFYQDGSAPKLCSDVCPGSYKYRIGKVCKGQCEEPYPYSVPVTGTPDYECVDQCNRGEYVYESDGMCVKYCPTTAKYSNDGVCRETCQDPTKPYGTPIAVSSNSFFACVNTCDQEPNTFVEVNKNCMNECETRKFKQHENGTKECLTAGTLCQFTAIVGTQTRCFDQCELDMPYLFEVSCYDKCPPTAPYYYESDKTCTFRCERALERYLDGSVCSKTCASGHYVIELTGAAYCIPESECDVYEMVGSLHQCFMNHCPSGKKFRNGQECKQVCNTIYPVYAAIPDTFDFSCMESCSQGPYLYQNGLECKNGCYDPNLFSQDGVCVAQCTAPLQYNIRTWVDSQTFYICVQGCLEPTRYVEFNGTCVDLCGGGKFRQQDETKVCLAADAACEPFIQVGTMKQCVSACEAPRPYSVAGECMDACVPPYPYSYSDKVCTATCERAEESFLDGSACSPACSSGYFYIDPDRQGQKTCLTARKCPENFPLQYHDNNLVQCVSDCPASRSYRIESYCTSDCGELQFWEGVEGSSNKLCVASCSSPAKPYSSAGECVAYCRQPTTHATLGICYEACTNEAYPLTVKKYVGTNLMYVCSDRCPDDRKYISGNACSDSCPIGKYRTVENQRVCVKLEDPCPFTISRDGELDECVDACQAPYEYVHDNKCLQSCQGVTKYAYPDKVCTDACTVAPYFYADGDKCTDSCTSGYYFVQDGMAVCTTEQSCPEDKQYMAPRQNQQTLCVAVCRDADMFAPSNGSATCVSACKDGEIPNDGVCVGPRRLYDPVYQTPACAEALKGRLWGLSEVCEISGALDLAELKRDTTAVFDNLFRYVYVKKLAQTAENAFSLLSLAAGSALKNAYLDLDVQLDLAQFSAGDTVYVTVFDSVGAGVGLDSVYVTGQIKISGVVSGVTLKLGRLAMNLTQTDTSRWVVGSDLQFVVNGMIISASNDQAEIGDVLDGSIALTYPKPAFTHSMFVFTVQGKQIGTRTVLQGPNEREQLVIQPYKRYLEALKYPTAATIFERNQQNQLVPYNFTNDITEPIIVRQTEFYAFKFDHDGRLLQKTSNFPCVSLLANDRYVGRVCVDACPAGLFSYGSQCLAYCRQGQSTGNQMCIDPLVSACTVQQKVWGTTCVDVCPAGTTVQPGQVTCSTSNDQALCKASGYTYTRTLSGTCYLELSWGNYYDPENDIAVDSCLNRPRVWELTCVSQCDPALGQYNDQLGCVLACMGGLVLRDGSCYSDSACRDNNMYPHDGLCYACYTKNFDAGFCFDAQAERCSLSAPAWELAAEQRVCKELCVGPFIPNFLNLGASQCVSNCGDYGMYQTSDYDKTCIARCPGFKDPDSVGVCVQPPQTAYIAIQDPPCAEMFAGDLWAMPRICLLQDDVQGRDVVYLSRLSLVRRCVLGGIDIAEGASIRNQLIVVNVTIDRDAPELAGCDTVYVAPIGVLKGTLQNVTIQRDITLTGGHRAVDVAEIAGHIAVRATVSGAQHTALAAADALSSPFFACDISEASSTVVDRAALPERFELVMPNPLPPYGEARLTIGVKKLADNLKTHRFRLSHLRALQQETFISGLGLCMYSSNGWQTDISDTTFTVLKLLYANPHRAVMYLRETWGQGYSAICDYAHPLDLSSDICVAESASVTHRIGAVSLTDCPAGYVLEGLVCVFGCKRNQYVGEGGSCVDLQAGELSYRGQKLLSPSCPAGTYKLGEYQCVDACPAGYVVSNLGCVLSTVLLDCTSAKYTSRRAGRPGLCVLTQPTGLYLLNGMMYDAVPVGKVVSLAQTLEGACPSNTMNIVGFCQVISQRSHGYYCEGLVFSTCPDGFVSNSTWMTCDRCLDAWYDGGVCIQEGQCAEAKFIQYLEGTAYCREHEPQQYYEAVAIDEVTYYSQVDNCDPDFHVTALIGETKVRQCVPGCQDPYSTWEPHEDGTHCINNCKEAYDPARKYIVSGTRECVASCQISGLLLDLAEEAGHCRPECGSKTYTALLTPNENQCVPQCELSYNFIRDEGALTQCLGQCEFYAFESADQFRCLDSCPATNGIAYYITTSEGKFCQPAGCQATEGNKFVKSPSEPECVAGCGADQVIEGNVCRDRCSNKMYLNASTKTCAATCESGVFKLVPDVDKADLHCVLQCTTSYPVFEAHDGMRRCMGSCAETVQLQNTNLYLKEGTAECVGSCAVAGLKYTTFDGTSCTDSCSASGHVVKGDRCVTACGDTSYLGLEGGEYVCKDSCEFYGNWTQQIGATAIPNSFLCNSGCDSGIYEKIDGTHCLDACSQTLTNNTLLNDGRCVDVCPDMAPYNEENQCTTACTHAVIWGGNTCHSGCVYFVADDGLKTCVPNTLTCPTDYKYTKNINIQPHECVKSCHGMLSVQEELYYYCAASCDGFVTVMEAAAICTPECDGNIVLGANLTSIPHHELHPFLTTDNQYCVSACPGGFALNATNNTCSSTCVFESDSISERCVECQMYLQTTGRMDGSSRHICVQSCSSTIQLASYEVLGIMYEDVTFCVENCREQTYDASIQYFNPKTNSCSACAYYNNTSMQCQENCLNGFVDERTQNCIINCPPEKAVLQSAGNNLCVAKCQCATGSQGCNDQTNLPITVVDNGKLTCSDRCELGWYKYQAQPDVLECRRSCPESTALNGTQCQECAAQIFQDGKNQCVQKCPSDFPHLSGTLCQASCPSFIEYVVVNGITQTRCREKCGKVGDVQWYTLGQYCVQDCSVYDMVAQRTWCQEECPSASLFRQYSPAQYTVPSDKGVPVTLEGTRLVCVGSCGSGAFLVDARQRYICQEKCLEFWVSEALGARCVSECPRFHKANSERQCIPTCTGQALTRYLEGSCVDKCPGFVLDPVSLSCTAVCPQPWFEEFGTEERLCTEGCPHNALKVPMAHAGYTQCVTQCPATRPYITPAGECHMITSCPKLNEMYYFRTQGTAKHCVSREEDCTVYVQIGSSRECFPSCADTVPLMPYLSIKACVSSCPLYYTEKGLCETSCNYYTVRDSKKIALAAKQCPTDAPYLLPGTGCQQCVKECKTLGLYIKENSMECITSCPDYYNVDETACVSACPLQGQVRYYKVVPSKKICMAGCEPQTAEGAIYTVPYRVEAGIVQCKPVCPIGQFSMPDMSCVKQCPQYLVTADVKCLLECPKEAPYGNPQVISWSCTATCPQNIFQAKQNALVAYECVSSCGAYRRAAANQQYECVAKCDADEFLYSQGEGVTLCVKVCPTLFASKTKCVTACSEAEFYESIGTQNSCLEKCSASVLGNLFRESPTSKKCVKKCADTDVTVATANGVVCSSGCPYPQRLDTSTGLCSSTCYFRNVAGRLQCMDDHKSCGQLVMLYHEKNMVECVAACNYFWDGVCVLECSSGYYQVNSTGKYCVSQCSHYGFVNEQFSLLQLQCTDSCATTGKYFLQGKVCVAQCTSGVYDEEKTCLESLQICALYRAIGDAFQCIQACEPGQVVEDRRCKPECTIYFYTEQRLINEHNMTACVQKCSTLHFDSRYRCITPAECQFYTPEDGQRRCVSTCSTKYVFGGECVTSCSRPNVVQNSASTPQVCGTSCTGTTPFQYQGMCVISCTSQAYVEDTRVCVENPADSVQCLFYRLSGSVKVCVSKCAISEYINGKECVTKCPASGAVSTQGYCVSQCTPNIYINGTLPRICLDSVADTRCKFTLAQADSVLCLSDCPQRVFSSTCVSRCENSFLSLDLKTCVSKCPGKNRYRLSTAAIGGEELVCIADTQECKFEERQDDGATRCYDYCPQFLQASRCVPACSPGTFFDVSDCVNRCPNYKFIDGQVCKTSCVPAVYNPSDFSCVASLDLCPVYWYNATNQHYSCLQSCPGALVRVGRNCTASCPSDLPLLSPQRECVEACGSKYVRHGIECLDRCPAEVPYVNGSRHCVTSCPRNTTTTYLYQKADGNTYCSSDSNGCRFIQQTLTTVTCLDYCEYFQRDTDSRDHCLTKCPGSFQKVLVGAKPASKCLAQCLPGHFQILSTLECVTECPSNFLVSGSQCIAQCQPGTSLIDGVCQQKWLKKNFWAVALLVGFAVIVGVGALAALIVILGKRVNKRPKLARPMKPSKVTVKSRQSSPQQSPQIKLPSAQAAYQRYANVTTREPPKRFPDFDQIISEGVREKMALELKKSAKVSTGHHKQRQHAVRSVTPDYM